MKRLVLAAYLGVVTPAYATASPVGDWLVADRSARVAISPCGPNLCGSISWSADGGDVGQPILLQMKPDGQRWSGTVVDVRDGKRYLAHIHLQSDDRLRLDGCVLGGIICSGEVWTRTKAQGNDTVRGGN